MSDFDAWEGAKTPSPDLLLNHPCIERQKIKPCCQDTIETHAHFNPMMVCQSCKYLIKCFTSEAAYRNYLIFCKSRGRHVLIDEFEKYKVAIFKNYEPFR